MEVLSIVYFFLSYVKRTVVFCCFLRIVYHPYSCQITNLNRILRGHKTKKTERFGTLKIFCNIIKRLDEVDFAANS